MLKTVIAVIVMLALAFVVVTVLEFDDRRETADLPTEGTETQSDSNTLVESTEDQGASDQGATDQDASDQADVAVDDTQATTSGDAADVASGDSSAGSPDGLSSTEDDALENVPPRFDIVRVETTGDAVMAGRAAPGAAVEIHSHDGLIAEAVADEKGDWVIVLEEPLPPGSHELWLQSQGADGTVLESSQAVAMLVPDSSEASSSTATDTDTDTDTDQPEEAIAVLLPRDVDGEQDDGGKVEILQEPEEGVGLAGGDGLTLDTLNYDEAGDVSLSGQAEPGTEVRAYVDGELAGRTLADSAGDWQIMLDQPVDLGLHALRVDQVDEGGVVLGRVETPFDRESLQFPESADPVVIIQPGNNLWTIARHTYGSGFKYTQIFEANQGQIADPHLIYPGQIFVLPVVN